MSNNNRNNNRRRGRGNNRSQGGNQLNRIDSRARGNAPQLLEKYKKLAHDAALNGDRVQAEYYLQFADHYFRVIADSRSQKDEQRPRRDFDREGGDDQDYFEDEFDRGQRHESRRREEPAEASEETEEGERASEAVALEGDEYEPADNPFTRSSRGKPRRGRRERDEVEDEDRGNRLDPSALPGAIGNAEPAAEEGTEEARDEEPAPARRALKPRRPRARSSDDEELEAVG